MNDEIDLSNIRLELSFLYPEWTELDYISDDALLSILQAIGLPTQIHNKRVHYGYYEEVNDSD